MKKMTELLNEIFKGYHIEQFLRYVLISKDKKYSSVSEIISFQVLDTYIYIHSINNKVGISGKEIIQKIEEYAIAINRNLIFLEDASFVKWKGLSFELYVINICKCGLSYYNELGYYSDTSTEIYEEKIKEIGRKLYEIIRYNKDEDVGKVMKMYRKAKSSINYKKQLFKVLN